MQTICKGLLLLFFFLPAASHAQTPLIGNIPGRSTISLNGAWSYIIDPYETGFYDYRYKERAEKDPEAYWNTDVPASKMDRKEHGYSKKNSIKVPGDWNSQGEKFSYYEGTVWYQRYFDYDGTVKSNLNTYNNYLYFGAVNYRADVYLNGKKLGTHKGGFTPFNFKIPDTLLHLKNNFLVVKVDNKRYADEVPTLNTDWWNYGGITRDVKLVSVPGQDGILDYSVQLKPGSDSGDVEAWVKLTNAVGKKVRLQIPELGISQLATQSDRDTVRFSFRLPPSFQRWSPETPRLYEVEISTPNDVIKEKIGFRTISTKGKQLLLNDRPVFLRGISIHGEIPQEGRRAFGEKDARQLLSWAKELDCNMVRLAHYPHDEYMTRIADSMGILVWSEIPVYWTIDFGNKEVLDKAKTQLDEMIARDHNRASVIIWSVGNETPVSEMRTVFMRSLLEEARRQDPTRLVSAALEVNYGSGQNLHTIDDPLGAYVDVVAFNEYLGWYGGTPASCRTTNWSTVYNKPLFISETGAEALGGFHADSATLWSEEFQEWYYREQVSMLKRMPDNFVGISPWILADFRSPRRNNPVYQQGWNNKGLIDQKGRKKKAFFILKAYYRQMQAGHKE